MIRVGWWVETNPNGVIDMTEESWGRVWFGTGVSEVEVSVNLANADAVLVNELVNEVDRDSDVLDSGGDCVCVENIDAGLAVNVERHRMSGCGWKAEKRRNILGVNGAFASCESSTSLAVSGVEGHEARLNLFPVKSTAAKKKEDTLDRSACLMITGMVTIHHADEAVREIHCHKFWRVKVNTKSMIAIDETPRVDYGPVWMGGKKSDDAIKASKGSCRRTLSVPAKAGEGKTELKATPNVDVHELTENFRVGAAITLDQGLKLRWSCREVFKELNFIGRVSAKGSVHRLETFRGGGRKELVDDGLEDVF